MKINYLSKVNSPEDVKKLSYVELESLCEEIRHSLIDTVSQNGGHLASNLGVVELTVALHKIFNSPEDQIVFDVGHQCYTHKLLTGRYGCFSTLRAKNGISGFCRPSESKHDIFYSGHSSTSVSSGLGLAVANNINKNGNYVITVIGDGSFTGGMVYEALNNGGRSGAKHIIILNDNKMSISENVGSFAKYLAAIRSTPRYYSFKAKTESVLNKFPFGEKLAGTVYKIKTDIKNRLYTQSTFFEDLGYRYMGPVDGHNIENLCDALEASKSVNGPVLLHVITVKGKGYEHAEKDPSIFHGVPEFDIDTGEAISSKKSFCDVFGNYIVTAAKNDKSIAAITAAMGLGTGLRQFSAEYPERFFDVGIAEEHAVTFASGLSKNNMKPVYAVYSTFLQRCYDQLVHDIALQKLHFVLATDRAGFVGEDGETHHGILDVAFLSTIPNIEIYSPCNFKKLEYTLDYALYKQKGFVCVRYPRGTEKEITYKLNALSDNISCYGDNEADKVIVTYGRITAAAIEAADELIAEGIKTKVISLNKIKPLPEELFGEIMSKSKIFFFEEGIRSGGVGEKLAARLMEKGYKGEYFITAVEDRFVQQAKVDELLCLYGLDKESMIKKITEN